MTFGEPVYLTQKTQFTKFLHLGLVAVSLDDLAPIPPVALLDVPKPEMLRLHLVAAECAGCVRLSPFRGILLTGTWGVAASANSRCILKWLEFQKPFPRMPFGSCSIRLTLRRSRHSRFVHGYRIAVVLIFEGGKMRDRMVKVCEHPKLDARYFVSDFPRPLGEMDVSSLTNQLCLAAQAPIESDDTIRKAVRDMLRVSGFKPTGRSKPASEYLLKAEAAGRLGSINLAVDACNVCSLHSGLPISVIDLDLAVEPLSIQVAESGSSYVFNQSGQEIDIGGLLCLFDQSGPCANAIKDSQRTKTSDSTSRTLSVIWGTQEDTVRTLATETWYRSLLEEQGARVCTAEYSE